MAKREMKTQNTSEQPIEQNETVADVKEATPVYGFVKDCTMLNIRKKPSVNGDVVTIVKANARLVIDMGSSTKEWYKVETDDHLEGYCMKKYVKVNK